LVARSSLIVSGKESKGSESVVEGDEHYVLLEEVARSEEEASPATHNVGAPVEVHHDRPLLRVHLWGVDVETETVLISDGFIVRDVKLGTEGTIFCGIKGVRPMADFNWWLES